MQTKKQGLEVKSTHGSIDGDGEQRFGFVVERFGEDHLSAVWQINSEILCIRLQKQTHQQQIRNRLSFISMYQKSLNILTDAWSIE